jgi:hypothetical protein
MSESRNAAGTTQPAGACLFVRPIFERSPKELETNAQVGREPDQDLAKQQAGCPALQNAARSRRGHWLSQRATRASSARGSR